MSGKKILLFDPEGARPDEPFGRGRMFIVMHIFEESTPKVVACVSNFHIRPPSGNVII